ncbi:HTH La-type RNA-binding domain-containing protein [Trichostrongylus colubriformis]|uniref:HTH La-type RNA-binding domain-containing protein n=1 Tax=Trichostrongylus colubriformis TaxID=6319 RepID=A0AAN8FLN8_TRICO
MNSLELDDDAFYICTEMSPRCFVVQKAIQIDRSQIERMVGDLEKAPPPPVDAPPAPQLPYWFTTECRNNLVNCDVPAMSVPSAPSPIPPPLPMPDLKQQLKAQLEYYFSRENLITDRYLRCQMDADQFVPISIIAGFRKIVQLTSDYNLILQVLRESNQVEVDERGEKVRSVCRRCTIILREISEEHREEVEKMLSGGPPYVDLKYGLNNSWYVTFDNEETTQQAYLHLQNMNITFNNKPICVRIKAGGPPSDLPPIDRMPTQMPEPIAAEPQLYTPLYELGQLLASYGYVPRATFRPGATVVHVQDEARQRMNRHGQPSHQRNQHARSARTYTTGTNGYAMHPNGAIPSHSSAVINGTIPSTSHYGGMERRHFREQTSQRGGRGGASGGGPRRGTGDRNYHQGGRRNGGANGSNHDTRRRSDYCNGSGGTGGGSTNNVPALSVSTGNIAAAAAAGPSNTLQIERPRYNSFRRERNADSDHFSTNDTSNASSGKGRRWEMDSENGSDGHVDRKASSHSGCSAYSFEERAFPSLSEPKPEPEKPVEKPSFSCVAAGKRYAKPEPRKSYAEKLKEKTAKA